MYTPYFVCPFQPQIVFGQFFFQKRVSKQLEHWIFHKKSFQLWLIDVNFIDLTLKMKFDEESMRIWTFDIFRDF